MTITLLGNTDGVYVNPCNFNAYVDYTTSINYKYIDMEGVNGLVIHRINDGSMKIIQASGYNYERGLFCDLY